MNAQQLTLDFPRVLAVVEYPPDQPWQYARHRLEFATQEDARAHQLEVRCGGWICGRWLYPGTEWTPVQVQADCPDREAVPQ